ncbi:MAG: hypothetical protein WCE52_06625 [Candidatus Acidiferrum sp.]
MESRGEVGARDYMRLMADYLAGKIDVDQYTKAFFGFNKRRANLPDEGARELILRPHGDADDYEPDIDLRRTNRPWIAESELRERVAKSLCDLEPLGHSIER